MLKKILRELSMIREELQAIRTILESEKKNERGNQETEDVIEVVNRMIKNTMINQNLN